jgi:uncharacterized membrane protein YecN with MAPEG domain
MNVLLICTGLLGLIYAVLSIRVARLRGAKRVSLGDGGDPELQRWIRAHANFIEYVPICLILIWALVPYYGYRTIAGLAGMLVVARLLHAAGLLGYVGFGRVAGAALTLIVLLISSVWIALMGLNIRLY